jgi:hypothetical protein
MTSNSTRAGDSSILEVTNYAKGEVCIASRNGSEGYKKAVLAIINVVVADRHQERELSAGLGLGARLGRQGRRGCEERDIRHQPSVSHSPKLSTCPAALRSAAIR